MADKTFGVKVSEEINDRVKQMVEASGVSTKEWFEKAVALTEMNAVKKVETDYSKDIAELEVHTTRIYELVSSMMARSIYMKDHAIKEYADKLDQKETIIGEYQVKVKEAMGEAATSKQLADSLGTEKEEIVRNLEEQRAVNVNNQLLIDEYKGKNDTLTGLVTKYQAYAEENEQLKVEYAKERATFQAQVNEATIENQGQQNEIKELQQQLEVMKASHVIEVERLTERKEFEKDKAVLEAERAFQERLLQANDGYNVKMKELYDELAAVRREYEGKIEVLQAEVKSAKEQAIKLNDNGKE